MVTEHLRLVADLDVEHGIRGDGVRRPPARVLEHSASRERALEAVVPGTVEDCAAIQIDVGVMGVIPAVEYAKGIAIRIHPVFTGLEEEGYARFHPDGHVCANRSAMHRTKVVVFKFYRAVIRAEELGTEHMDAGLP